MKDSTVAFMKNVEHRVTPKKVAMMHNNATKLMKLPKGIQHKIVGLNSKKNDYMGFVVEPYSFFLNYEITEEQVQEYLSSDYELLPTSIFASTTPRYSAIIGCFNVHTSVFWGTRFELYIIAKNKNTNLCTWIIVDVQSNTFTYEPAKGFHPGTVDSSVFTTLYDRSLLCSVENTKEAFQLEFKASLKEQVFESLTQQLWIEGNLSVDYTSDNPKDEPFGLVFDPNEMQEAVSLNHKDVTINICNFKFITTSMKPYEICCFPFAQHYLTTIFPQGHEMKNGEDLTRRMNEIINEGAVTDRRI